MKLRSSKKMNICFISQEYPPETHGGGIGTYTYNMALALTKLGHTVHVITSTQNSEQTYLDSGVWVHRLKSRRINPKELWLMKHSYSVAKKISKIECEFDIVQARCRVSDVLGESLESNESTFYWNTDGENALGVLIRYMSQSIIWMESLEHENREHFKRSVNDIPHYAEALETHFQIEIGKQ